MHGFIGQIAVEAVGIERRVRCHKLGNGLEAGVESCVRCLFVSIHLSAPKTLAVEAHVPVREIVLYKIRDSSSGFGRFVCLVRLSDFLDEGVEFGEYPSVDLGIFFRFVAVSLPRRCRVVAVFDSRLPAIYIGIESKETVGVIEGAEELAAHLIDSFGVELKVLPWAGVGEHIPAHGVGAIGIECPKGIDGIAEAFGHFVAVFIEDKSVGDDVFVRHLTLNHRVNGMECEEPSAGLIHALGDEICGARQIGVLEGIVVLCIGHCARIEPYIDEVEFAFHGFAGGRDENDRVHVRAVEVNDGGVIVGFGIIACFMVRPWVGFHEASLDRFVDFIEQFRDGTDAYFLGSILGAPDRQRSTPVTGAGEVPVVEVIEPLTETTRTGGFRLPVDGLIEGDHLLTRFSGLDKPAVQRVIENRFIGTPAMGVRVYVFLRTEQTTVRFHLQTEVQVQALRLRSRGFIVLSVDGELRVVGVLYPSAGVTAVEFVVDIRFVPFLIEVFYFPIFTGEIDHRTRTIVLGLHV